MWGKIRPSPSMLTCPATARALHPGTHGHQQVREEGQPAEPLSGSDVLAGHASPSVRSSVPTGAPSGDRKTPVHFPSAHPLSPSPESPASLPCC